MIDLLAIEHIAQACRTGLSALRQSSRFRDFPRGNCGEAAELVGRILKERLDCDGQYVFGSYHPLLKPTQSHAWFETSGVIVDITYDQFGAIGLAGWVFPAGSDWHAAFTEIDKQDVCMPEHWLMYPHEGYRSILQKLAERP